MFSCQTDPKFAAQAIDIPCFSYNIKKVIAIQKPQVCGQVNCMSCAI